jgi:hypothetical protein
MPGGVGGEEPPAAGRAVAVDHRRPEETQAGDPRANSSEIGPEMITEASPRWPARRGGSWVSDMVRPPPQAQS